MTCSSMVQRNSCLYPYFRSEDEYNVIRRTHPTIGQDGERSEKYD